MHPSTMLAVVLVLVVVAGVRGQYSQYGQTSNQRQQSLDRYLLDSPYNLCRQPLFARSNVTATSWWHDR